MLAAPAAVVVTLAAAGAAWVGSRAVLRATPAQAMSGASVPSPDSPRTSRLRRLVTAVLIASGAVVLAAAAAVGESGNAFGFLLAALGAMVSGTGLLVGARLVVPRLVAAASLLLGTDPPSKVAARNAIRDPGRTTRSTMGLVIGVTLVTTFAAGFAALRTSARSWDQTAAQAAQTEDILRNISAIMICIVVVSSAIAAVGFVSTMSLGVIQRTREIGLLRALGFTAGQVRTMITKESVALSATAVTFGMALGSGVRRAGRPVDGRLPDRRVRVGCPGRRPGRDRGGRRAARPRRVLGAVVPRGRRRAGRGAAGRRISSLIRPRRRPTLVVHGKGGGPKNEFFEDA